MKLEEAIQEYLTTKRPELTHKSYVWYESKLRLFSEWCGKDQEAEQINNALVVAFLDTLKAHSSHTRHGYIQVLKSLLRWCVENEEGEVSEKAVKRIKLPKVEKDNLSIFSQEEISRLFHAAERSPLPQRNRALLALLLDTGARASELCFDATRPEESTGLHLEDLHISGAEAVRPYVEVVGKGRKSRRIPLGQQARVALRLYVRRYRGRSEQPYVFLNRVSEPLTVHGLGIMLDKLGEDAKVEDIYPHKFRHTFACMFLVNGGSIYDLKILMGHEDIRTTMLYLRAVEAMGVIDRSASVLDTLHKR